MSSPNQSPKNSNKSRASLRMNDGAYFSFLWSYHRFISSSLIAVFSDKDMPVLK